MRTLFNSSNYGNDLRLTRSDALLCSHSGDCESDVLTIMNKNYVKKQLVTFEPEKLKKELKEFGAWDEIELSNHVANLKRWVWLSAVDISENNL